MNAKEKRKFENNMVDIGFKRKDVKNFIADLIAIHPKAQHIPDGEKVKLDYEQITTHPDYVRKVDEYKQWVEENQDTEFSVLNNKTYKGQLVELLKDQTVEKWIMYTGDLIKVNGANVLDYFVDLGYSESESLKLKDAVVGIREMLGFQADEILELLKPLIRKESIN